MSHRQEVEQVPGEQIWVETRSWSDIKSPVVPLLYTSLGGEVNVWKKKPPQRRLMPVWLKALFSFPGFYLFYLGADAINKILNEKRRYEGKVVIRLRNIFYDKSGREVMSRINIWTNDNPHRQEEWASGLFYPRYPRLGDSRIPVVKVETEAEVFIGQHSFHHITWEGQVDKNAQTQEVS